MEYYSNNDSKGVPIVLKLLKYLDKQNGFYIEAGANDGLMQSNTKFFEDQKGWSGLLVEPSTVAFEKLKVNRPKNILKNVGLVSDAFKENELSGDFDGSLMGSVSGKRSNSGSSELIRVPCCTLASILEEIKVPCIDLFSLDAEGYELEILKGSNLRKFKPRFLIIEIYKKDKFKIFQFLRKNGYIFVENISKYNKIDNPKWDGSHNDYLFKYDPVFASKFNLSQFFSIFK